MNSMASISDLQAEASNLVKQAEAEGIVPISRHGRTVAFLVSREKLAAILETMELQKNPELMALVRADKAGKVRFSTVPDEI
jgi:prevent-host-death family protein